MPPEYTSQKTSARWKPLDLIAPLITLVMLGVTLSYWSKGERALEEARQHAFQETAEQVASWQRDGLGVVPVAVNLSALQFHQAGGT